MNKLVSVITPVYNSALFLKDTIKSVIEQTYQNWELILVDDCSTDTSASIILDFANIDIRIKYKFLKCNKGAAAARNEGLRIAKGAYIAFIDSDDIWLPNKLSLQIAIMQKNNYPITYTSYDVFNETDVKNYTIQANLNLDYPAYLKNTIIGCSTSIIDKRIVGEFSFREDMRTRQDTKLWLTLLKKGYIAYGVDEVLVKYRVHKASISSNKIKAAAKVWDLYYRIENLGLLRSIYYFAHYSLNALKKRKLI